MVDVRSIARILVVVAIGTVVAVAAFFLFVAYPTSNPRVALVRLLGIVLVVGAIVAGLRVGSRIAASVFPDHNVAEVAVEGVITRDSGGTPLPSSPTRPSADDIVEQIQRADADGNSEALMLRLNTPGGQVVPSDDIRLAAAEFDGPTVAYATDTCASGGYWIASGCDEIWAREGSIVGSIGVIGSRINATDLADRLGISYERLAAGEYKDAGLPLKEMSEDDRTYLQGIIDGYYDRFVDRVTEGRDLTPAEVQDTEARVYLGPDAKDLGLVDAIGPRDDVEDAVATKIGVDEVTVKEFQPRRRLAERIRVNAQGIAYALGAGLAGVVSEGTDFEVELR